MAIQKDIEAEMTDSLIAVPNAYIKAVLTLENMQPKAVKIDGKDVLPDKQNTLTILIFSSKSAKDSGAKPLATIIQKVTAKNVDTTAKAYSYLKTLPEFKGAKDL